MPDNHPLNQDNIVSAVARVSVLTKTSKTGNPYCQATVYLLNGYSFNAFLDENQQQAVRDSLKLAQGSTTALSDDKLGPDTP